MADWWNNVAKGWLNTMHVEWWENVPAFERFFWYLAVPFTVVFLVQLLTTFIGMSGGGDDLEGFDSGSGDIFGFRLMTFRNFVVFFTVFGWAGITLANSSESETVTIVVAVFIGFVVMAVVASLFYFTTRLQENGVINLHYAKGRTGEVYLPIPAKRLGVGKIHITFQGTMREVEAMTEGPSLARGTLVNVVETISGNIVLVEKIVVEKRVSERRAQHV